MVALAAKGTLGWSSQGWGREEVGRAWGLRLAAVGMVGWPSGCRCLPCQCKKAIEDAGGRKGSGKHGKRQRGSQVTDARQWRYESYWQGRKGSGKGKESAAADSSASGSRSSSSWARHDRHEWSRR